MQVRFLLGPAGSGKTQRCLAEIRAALLAAPDGPPLLLLAPKQATFQLERQLLADPKLAGYARLKIVSFERLAEFVLNRLQVTLPPSLSEEGRIMVLRALLLQHATELQRFGPSGRRPGFAKQLSLLLSELGSHGLSAARLRVLSGRADLAPELRAKLADLTLLSQRYADWLADQGLRDVNTLLERAAEQVREQLEANRALSHQSRLQIAGIWMDGFAEMTPAEIDLLAAVLPLCERATLAFCLEGEPQGETSWFSIWAVVGKSFQRCRERIGALPGAEIQVEILQRHSSPNRFRLNPALAHLESHWSAPGAFDSQTCAASQLPRLVACTNPEAEASFAAREVLQFVHRGGRFREAAVLVRTLDSHHKPLERAFRRYGIPYFLDRREGVAHHPLAELTRSALRTVAFDWRHEDWFAALKSGFSTGCETDFDRLENEALARGWRGVKWRSPLRFEEGEAELGVQLEGLRQQIIPPFLRLGERLSHLEQQPTGRQLAVALRELWQQLRVEETLQNWGAQGTVATGFNSRLSAIHSSVWEQMNAWLEDLERAFPHTALSLPEWLPVLEAGLSSLTVGVIPPALDQVLIGAIDRSRNPDLKLVLVLGLNEGVFPAAPGLPQILSESERDALNVPLGPNLQERLARERYFGYIACTRASEQLVLTYARADASGNEQNSSAFIPHLKRILPGMTIAEFAPPDWRQVLHVTELAGVLLETQHADPQTSNWSALRQLPAVAALDRSLRALQNPALEEKVTPQLTTALFGPVLKTSVSRLEQFAACPFRFFVHSGLRAEERKLFELDFRERGSFQHDVLQKFHERLTARSLRWRDLTPSEARELVGQIAAELTPEYRGGLLRDSAQTRFTTRVLTRALQEFIEVIVDWMHTRYEFDPVAVELDFGPQGSIPAWTLDLGDCRQLLLRGRIDRVDVFRDAAESRAWCVVMDYKSSMKKLDPILLQNGVQLQLLSYLNVLRHVPDAAPRLGVTKLRPAGAFYVNLRAGGIPASSRAALTEAAAARRRPYRHTGRFDLCALPKLDSSGDSTGEQFDFRLTKERKPYANSAGPLPPPEFAALLDQVETQLREMGQRIFAGDAKVDPYRKGSDTPCRFCDYAEVCRIDPWTHEYRLLRRLDPATASPEDAE